MLSVLRRTAKGTAIALLVCLVLIPLQRTTIFDDLNLVTFDFTVDHAGLSDPSKDIVLVDFDEATYQKIQQYPIPRSIFTDAIKRIAAGKPRVIGLDVFLSEPRTTAEDKAMQEALTAAGNVVLASQSAAGTVPALKPLPIFCQPEDATAPSGFCAEGKPGALAYAFVNMPIDSDGFVRQGNLFFGDSVSFPLFLAQQFTGEGIKPGQRQYATLLGRPIRYQNTDLKTFLIGSWGSEPATRIPAWKLLAGDVPPETFKDKLVLIGQTSSASGDTHLSPLYRVAGPGGVRLKLGGTAIHAAAIRTLLEGSSVKIASNGQLYLTIFVFAATAATLLLNCDLMLGLACLMGIMALGAGLSLLLFAKLRFWVPFLPIETALAITLPFTLGLRYTEERLLSHQAGLQREQLMKLFSSYVNPAVAETIWQRRDELFLGGEEHTATVMFTDIRGFTALSNDQPPAVVLGWLNRYVAAMDEVIRHHGGFLNKFIGDGLMIIFGLPIGQGVKTDARRAVEAALAMLARVETLNAETVEPACPHLRIGVGIHTGPLMAGSIGSLNRQEYSVIGETVNLASRLEGLNKQFKTEILMSTATMQLVADAFPGLESLGLAQVAGLREPVEVFTVRNTAAPNQELTHAAATTSGASR